MSNFNELDILNNKNKKEVATKSDLKKRIKELQGINKDLKEENEKLIYNNRFILEESEKLKLEINNLKNEVLKINTKKEKMTETVNGMVYYIVDINSLPSEFYSNKREFYIRKDDFDYGVNGVGHRGLHGVEGGYLEMFEMYVNNPQDFVGLGLAFGSLGNSKHISKYYDYPWIKTDDFTVKVLIPRENGSMDVRNMINVNLVTK